jgi:hypothetical protein
MSQIKTSLTSSLDAFRKNETIVTLLVRSDLNKMTPMEVLGEVQTHDLFKQSQKEVQGQ